MKKTDEIMWEDPLQMVARARCPNTSNNELRGVEKSLSMMTCCCFVFGRGSEWGQLFIHGKI